MSSIYSALVLGNSECNQQNVRGDARPMVQHDFEFGFPEMPIWTTGNVWMRNDRGSERGMSLYRCIVRKITITVIRRRLVDYKFLIDIEFDSKTATAIFVASDCHRGGAKMRFDYVQELKKAGLKVDGYGECFGKRYEGNFTKLLQHYKFYLAFENAILCREYITEKFWTNALMRGLIPVVWGPTKADVERVAPPHSFIHVDDFGSISDLVSYLTYLDQDDAAYKEYFHWRAQRSPAAPDSMSYSCPHIPSHRPPMHLGVPSVACILCRYLKTRHIEPGQFTIPSLSEWWYGTETPECLEKTLSTRQKAIMKTEHNFLP